MMDPFAVVQLILLSLSAILLIVLIFLAIEGVRVVHRVRRLADRVDMMTDVKEWFYLLRKAPRRRKK